MKEFKDKVAVVTGAASGIGRGIAERCVQQGIKTVLADIEAEPLAQTEAALKASGATVLALRTNVAQASDVEALAERTLSAFGAVHILFNNAGVAAGASVWESTAADWEWTIGVNLWGVIHGVRVFVPIMLAQDTACHIVNTASIAGLNAGPGLGPYRVSKHGVVALSETLHHELVQRKAKIKVSVLCPGFVRTRIMEAERNRQVPVKRQVSPELAAAYDALRQAVQAGIPPDQVAEVVFDAIAADKFYIFTHPEWNDQVRIRMEDILEERNPTAPRSWLKSSIGEGAKNVGQ